MNRGFIGALYSSVAVALLAGCGGSQPPIGAPGAIAQRAERPIVKPFRVLYGFAGGRDGSGSGRPFDRCERHAVRHDCSRRRPSDVRLRRRLRNRLQH